ncbi:DUF4124 domain-containing protein [Thalassotalea algicola]|uniref:DUF4124 domain-containing protein n=1 Tax=Thalassotalea algicola TaxID=2716224 RepID=UPI001B7D5C3D|nr:DUF4124 domain-containing protein [Thalassotalea algicola]
MAKWLLALPILIISTVALAQQSAEVYRWVDEQGNVHFSDMPKDKAAKLYFVKPGITSKADEAKLAQTQNETDQSAPESSGDMEMMEVPNSAEACRDLRVEMNKRSRELNGGTPQQARLARIFLDQADKILARSNCQ